MIFIGIMFTAVIPMFLVMKQADTIYEIRKHELGILDQERMDEEVYFYVFPVTKTSTTLTLKVQNRGNLVVNVVQVWINDLPHLLEDFKVQPMNWNQMVLDNSIGFTPVPGTWYFIKIITDRGNIFYSDSGSLHYISESVGWDEGMFAINFLISYPAAGWFNIEIRQSSETGLLLTSPPFSIHKSSNKPVFDFFKVPSAATYHVKITKGSQVIYNALVTIGWPNGSQIEWVFA